MQAESLVFTVGLHGCFKLLCIQIMQVWLLMLTQVSETGLLGSIYSTDSCVHKSHTNTQITHRYAHNISIQSLLRLKSDIKHMAYVSIPVNIIVLLIIFK